ncbi:MAG: TonB-dependent receptor plug domain-containing protein, partial [Pseudomonadota bacterium]
MGNTLKDKLLATSMLAAMLGAVPFAAQAQEVERVADADEADAEATLETVRVTGSRLNQANITSSSPVTTVDSEAFDLRGTVDTVDLVNTLPQAFAGQSGAIGNGASGTSTLNLRGLGSTRTLVLANGKRLPPGSPTNFAADLNLIPSQLVERVEIVTGGASAVYGSDAIGGVANFILRNDFEGVELDIQYGFNQTANSDSISQAALDAAPAEEVISRSLTDNPTYDINGIIGTNLDNGRGNVTAYFRFLSQDGVLQNNRDFSRCAQIQTGPDSAICVGSNAGPFPSTFFIPQLFQTDAAGNNILDGDGNPIPFGPGGTFSLEDDGSLLFGGTNPFNFNPLNPLLRPTERFNGGFSGYYNINEHFEVYADFGFTQNSTASQIAPSASFSGTADTFGCDNPFLSAEQVDLFCTQRGFGGDDIVTVGISRRVVEAGPRTTSFTNTNFRVVSGVRGEIVPGLDYDVFGQIAETNRNIIQTNQVTLTALEQSIDVVTDPATGQPICRAELEGEITGCVPFNVFDPTATNEGIGAFLDTPSLNGGDVRQFVFGGTLTADGTEFG